MRTKQSGALIFVDQLSLCRFRSSKRDDRLPQQISEIVAVLSLVEDARPALAIDLGEELKLTLKVLDYLSVEGAEDERFLGLKGGVEWRVHLKDLLGVSEREKHLSYNNSNTQP